MKYILDLIKKNYVVLLSFFIPVIILQTAYMTWGIYPVGNATVLIIDLYHQYAPFLSELQEKIRDFSGLFYSWKGGLGGGFLPLYAYYLASPLNILTILFPKEYLSEMVLFLVLVKTGLSGAFFCIYLGSKQKEKNLAKVAISIAYALSGFIMAYSWNIMWLDCIYLLPLVILGLEKLIRENRGLLYVITLGIALYSNFYMAFFICFFIVLYYPVCLFKYHNSKNFKLMLRRTLKFAAFSLIGAGLSAILILPAYFALRLTSAAGDTFPKDFKVYYDLFDYISRHFLLAPLSIWNGMPNMYSSMTVLILLPMYFFSKNISLKEKLLHAFLILVLIVSFNFNMLDFIWHGFHFPNNLPYRFSFVYIFLILSLCYEGYGKSDEYTGKQIGISFSVILGILLLTQKFNEALSDIYVVYAGIIFTFIYAGVFTLHKHNKTVTKSFVKMIFLFAIITELLVNTIGSVWRIGFDMGYTSRDEYISGKKVAIVREQIKSISEKDEGFYRMEVFPPKTTNDPFLYNYRGLSIFSSTYPVLPVEMMESMGFHSNGINSFKYEGSTAFLDSFFGLKYLFYREQDIEEELYKLKDSIEGVNIYENPYVLPLGFYGSYDLENYSGRSLNPFTAQNAVVNDLCGSSDIFVPIEHGLSSYSNFDFISSGTRYYRYKRPDPESRSVVSVKIDIKSNEQAYLFLKLPSYQIDEGFVMLGEKKVEINASRSTLVNLGHFNEDTTALLNLIFKDDAPSSGEFELFAYVLDIPVFEQAISRIKDNGFVIDTFKDTYISGHINVKEDGTMMFTIPYDKGWKVLVDDIPVETRALDGGLISFDINKGFHEISLKYVPEGFYFGAGISAISLLIIVVGFIRKW